MVMEAGTETEEQMRIFRLHKKFSIVGNQVAPLFLFLPSAFPFFSVLFYFWRPVIIFSI